MAFASAPNNNPLSCSPSKTFLLFFPFIDGAFLLAPIATITWSGLKALIDSAVAVFLSFISTPSSSRAFFR